jgi:hypothetical protein
VHEVRDSQAYRYNEMIAIPDIVTTSFDCRMYRVLFEGSSENV